MILLTLKQLLKDMCYQTTKGKNVIFQLTKGRYDEALMIGSHHRRERDRGMQLSRVLLGKDYTNTNPITNRSSTYQLLLILKHKYRTQALAWQVLYKYKYTEVWNSTVITQTQIQKVPWQKLASLTKM